MLNRTQERLAMLRGVSNGFAALFTSLAGLTVLMLAIPLVSGGQIEGVYLALLPLAAIASFEAVQPLSLALQQLEASQAAGRRLFELIDTPPAVREPHLSVTSGQRAAMAYTITFNNVRFRYNANDPWALDGVSFSVPSGKRIAIVGPSGSGKSTLVNLLLRFWEYDEGQITIGGQDVRDYRADDVRALLGVVSQKVHLFNATVQDNLLLANPDATDEQIRAACQQAQLNDFIETLPQGYNTFIGENGVLLSGGERQRLAIARVILKNAPILILDEATANLDTLTEQRLMQSLEPFMIDRTVLIISHRRVAIEHIDQVITLENGRVVRGRRRIRSRPRLDDHFEVIDQLISRVVAHEGRPVEDQRIERIPEGQRESIDGEDAQDAAQPARQELQRTGVKEEHQHQRKHQHQQRITHQAQRFARDQTALLPIIFDFRGTVTMPSRAGCLRQIGRKLIGRQLHDDTPQRRSTRPAFHHPLPQQIKSRFAQHFDLARGKRIPLRRVEQFVHALELQNKLSLCGFSHRAYACGTTTIVMSMMPRKMRFSMAGDTQSKSSFSIGIPQNDPDENADAGRTTAPTSLGRPAKMVLNNSRPIRMTSTEITVTAANPMALRMRDR